MLISYEKKFLFVRVPKTGGTSIRTALSQYRNPHERQLYARIVRRMPLVPTPYRFLPLDARPHWNMLKVKRLIPGPVLNQLYKFAFVRHPVDWQVSVFKHIMRHENEGEFTRQFASVYKHRTFDDYIRWRIDSGAIPQIVQIIDENGGLLVDFVGRYESLSRDFDLICRRIEVPTPALQRLNQSPKEQIVSVDSSTVNRICDAYQIDFETFGYTDVGVVNNWQLDRTASFPQAAQTLLRAGGENYNPWRANVISAAGLQ